MEGERSEEVSSVSQNSKMCLALINLKYIFTVWMISKIKIDQIMLA